MAQNILCHLGHLKHESSTGKLVCRVCLRRREAGDRMRKRAKLGFAPTGKRNAAKPVPDSVCPKGHQRVRECNGRIVCKPCQHHRLRAQAAYRRARPCAHVEGSRGKLVLSLEDQIVCLDCVVEEANQTGL